MSLANVLMTIMLLSCSRVSGLVDDTAAHSGSKCPSSEISVRLPPTLTANFNTNASWQGPPSGWFYGNWKVAFSSNPDYAPLWNLEFDSSPVFPQPANGSQVNNDLTSWNAPCPNDTKIYTDFALDTEMRTQSFVFNTRGTGAYTDQTNAWELLAWGYDTDGVGYMLIYETAASTGGPADIDVEGREWGHPCEETRKALLDAVRAYNMPKLTNLTHQVVELPHDARRAGLSPYPCDQACANNTYLAEAEATLEKEIKECPG